MLTKVDFIGKIINDIAPNYFDADDYSGITKSRLGQFGVISEALGTIFENAIVNNAIKARNMLTATADRLTLLEEAASYPDLIIPNANPSQLSMFLGIPVNYLKSKCMVDSSNISFILDNDSVISVSGIKFLLDYDLKITGKLIDGRWIYSAEYILTKENTLSIVNNPYLITTIRNISNESYVLVNVAVSQLMKTYQYYNIVETEAIPLNGIDFDYTDKLAYFNVFYKSANDTEFTLIDKINYLSQMTSANKFVYYDTSTLQKIKLYIPDNLNFEFNSELRLDIYTTNGVKGSFTYTSGTVEVTPQAYNDKYDYTGVYFSPIVISNSAGGKDELSTEELRQMIMNYKATLRSIDNENDLTIYFNSLDNVNNMNFIKKRIDTLESMYTAFMLLRDINGTIISSNSLNIHLTNDDIDAVYVQTGRRIVKPSKTYSLKPDEDYIVITQSIDGLTATQITALENNTSKFLFGSPYLMVINENPQSVSYYLNSIDKDNTTTIEYYNEDAPIQFIVNKFNVKRNAINADMTYTLSMNIIPSSELPSGIIDESGNIIDSTILKICGYIYSSEQPDNITSYFPITITAYNATNKYFEASATLTTDDYITLTDKLRFTNSLYNSGEAATSDTVIDISGIKIGVGIYFKSTTFTDKSTYINIVPSMDSYGLVNVYTNKNDTATFMINMSKQIKSVITFVDEGAGVFSFDIKQVPLIRYTELSNNINRISDIIENTNSIITAMLSLIRNNMSIDYKFYATYGKSRYLTMENTATKLDRLNMSLKFRLRVSATKPDVAIATDVKTFIQPLVEQVNNLSITSSVYFSNIITQVENEFKYDQNKILSCELVQVNDYTTLYQSIINTTKPLTMMTKAELLEYVAEFTKLDINDITVEILYV